MTDATPLARRLTELARNLWWTWQPDVVALFRDLDPELWRTVNHNPLAFVAAMPAEALARRAEAIALESRIHFAFRRLEQYVGDRWTWGDRHCGVLRPRPVAYFCAEFALHESMPIYSGGLGALAGDHLKAASDLGVPLVGVGIFYGQGYFRQQVGADGWQRESYGHVDLATVPLRRITGADGAPLLVDVPIEGAVARIAGWRAPVGRATLVLLDSDVDANPPELRGLTAQLYGGDERTRIRQEIVLGVGGVRMLDAIGVTPGVIHLNEGHSAFAVLERARLGVRRDGLAFDEALRRVSRRTVFTTHTPVTAGHDWFPPDLVRDHLAWLAQDVGLPPDDLVRLGQAGPEEAFCMTVLALRAARFANGVSALHGAVTRRAWRRLWPGRADDEVPIGHVTNGVHYPTWLAPPMGRLCDMTLGADWRDRLPESLAGLAQVDAAAFWEVHQLLKRGMFDFVCRRFEERRSGDAAPPRLDVGVLTLTFAKRFAEYKRAALLFSDPERLARIVAAPGRGLQIVVSGKAHPRDDVGKRALQHVVGLAADPRFAGRLAFVEDYDMSVARHLVQGSDLWLNTPRRPLEACGTSGQKVLMNGGLNLSVLDGWWAEAWDGANGFAIGDGSSHADPAAQDARDAATLYDVLEREVVPLYYDHRDAADVPVRWVERVRRSVLTLAGRFNADRMLRDYARRCYLPAAGGTTSGGGSLA